MYDMGMKDELKKEGLMELIKKMYALMDQDDEMMMEAEMGDEGMDMEGGANAELNPMAAEAPPTPGGDVGGMP